MDIDCLKSMLHEEEGFSPICYKCPSGRLTIGYGHNCEDNTITREAGEKILEDDLNKVLLECQLNIDFWDELDDNRKVALADMAFNIGIDGLMKFNRTFTLLRQGQFAKAAENLKTTKWYSQVQKSRSFRITEIIRTGELPKLCK